MQDGDDRRHDLGRRRAHRVHQPLDHARCRATSSRPARPPGVGVFRDPPVFLEPGDRVRCEIEGIGTVENPVIDWSDEADEDDARLTSTRWPATMLALVKTAAGPGLELRDVPMPAIGINDVLIRVHKTGICGTDLHIESWDPWAARTIKPPLVVGHEFVGEIVEVGTNVADFQPGRPRLGRGPRRVRPLPPLPGRPPPPVRQDDRARRRARRGVRRVRRAADDQRVAPLAGRRRGGRRDLRPVRQRGPHRARLPGPRRGRARQRGRPDRADGHRRRPPRRRPARRRQRAERLSPRAGASGWARRSSSIRASGHSPTCSPSSTWSKASTSVSRCRATRPRCGPRSRRWPTVAASRSSASRPRRSASTSTPSCSRC